MNLKIVTIFSLLLTSIPLNINAQPQINRGAIHNSNGGVGGINIKGEKGQGGCAGIGRAGQAAAGCQGNYENNETGVNRNGSGRVIYNQGEVDSQTGGSGTRRNGSTFNRSTTGDYNLNEQTGRRQVERDGTTQNDVDYDYDKNASYSEGEFCRTVTGEAGSYQYNNSGQLSCQ